MPSSRPLPVGSPFSKSESSGSPALPYPGDYGGGKAAFSKSESSGPPASPSPGSAELQGKMLADIRGNLRILVALAVFWSILWIVGMFFTTVEFMAAVGG